jgi:tetratricopeptide (TPR) repeat protein
MLCCGHAAASGEDEKELFTSQVQAALDCYNNGDTARAVQLIDEASAQYLHTNWSYTISGQYLWYMGEHERALRCFDRATEVDPAYAGAWYYKGRSLSALGRAAEAEASFARAEELNPRYNRPWTEKWPYSVIIKHLPMIVLVIGLGGLAAYFVKNEVLTP